MTNAILNWMDVSKALTKIQIALKHFTEVPAKNIQGKAERFTLSKRAWSSSRAYRDPDCSRELRVNNTAQFQVATLLIGKSYPSSESSIYRKLFHIHTIKLLWETWKNIQRHYCEFSPITVSTYYRRWSRLIDCGRWKITHVPCASWKHTPQCGITSRSYEKTLKSCLWNYRCFCRMQECDRIWDSRY